MRRRLLSGDLLKTNDVGRKIIQDRPENGHPTYEFHFVRSRPIKIFEIKCRNANGAYGARPKWECSQAISWRLKKEQPDGEPVLATVIRCGQCLHREEPHLARYQKARSRTASGSVAPSWNICPSRSHRRSFAKTGRAVGPRVSIDMGLIG